MSGRRRDTNSTFRLPEVIWLVFVAACGMAGGDSHVVASRSTPGAYIAKCQGNGLVGCFHFDDGSMIYMLGSIEDSDHWQAKLKVGPIALPVTGDTAASKHIGRVCPSEGVVLSGLSFQWSGLENKVTDASFVMEAGQVRTTLWSKFIPAELSVRHEVESAPDVTGWWKVISPQKEEQTVWVGHYGQGIFFLAEPSPCHGWFGTMKDSLSFELRETFEAIPEVYPESKGEFDANMRTGRIVRSRVIGGQRVEEVWRLERLAEGDMP